MATATHRVSSGVVYENNPFLQGPASFKQTLPKPIRGSNLYVVLPGSGQQLQQPSSTTPKPTVTPEATLGVVSHPFDCANSPLHVHHTQLPVHANYNNVVSLNQAASTDDLNKRCLKSTGLFLGTSCNKFVSCLDGKATELNCPDGLLFNSDGLYCDRPENVQCNGRTSAAIVKHQDVNSKPGSLIHASLAQLSSVPIHHVVKPGVLTVDESQIHFTGTQQHNQQQHHEQQNYQQNHQQQHQQHQNNQQQLHQQNHGQQFNQQHQNHQQQAQSFQQLHNQQQQYQHHEQQNYHQNHQQQQHQQNNHLQQHQQQQQQHFQQNQQQLHQQNHQHHEQQNYMQNQLNHQYQQQQNLENNHHQHNQQQHYHQSQQQFHQQHQQNQQNHGQQFNQQHQQNQQQLHHQQQSQQHSQKQEQQQQTAHSSTSSIHSTDLNHVVSNTVTGLQQQHKQQHAAQASTSTNFLVQANQVPVPISPPQAVEAAETNEIPASGGGGGSRCLALRGQFPSSACHTFLNCWAGIATEQACPDGLLFSSKGYCDYPENVNCAGRSLIVAAPELKDKCLTPRGQFPSTTCNKFVNCWDGVILEQECPEGFLFSAKGYCDFSTKVDCGDRPVEPRGSNSTSKSDCPLENGTFRDRNNCSRYFTCIANKVVAKYECPEGLAYNDYIGVCDYDNRVDCSSEPLLFPAKRHNAPLLKRGDECPADFATYRDAKNCAAYYTCVSRKIVATYECPVGFNFNDEIGLCDYAEKVDCSKSPKVFLEPKNALPEITNDLRQKIESCTPGSMFSLNPQCTAVCLCRNGMAEIVQCPAGLAYDSKTDKCTLSHLAKC
ncbi:hypothetical protein NQ315_016836 [Exocentrus adspersus]|uniref:Chitin-binding type-2 domain-containing protein n=1 Tax=Exocentrus adspersus TaxID=1586481 RepID=A0AAV8VXK0_9CUCU|nr:hypothetical protein NQ315_016836 [Exocentrus adspersus]